MTSRAGRVAARHLLGRGHTHIAFLALHSEKSESSLVDWSAQRAIGWREALQAAQVESGELLFQPAHDAFGMAIQAPPQPNSAAMQRDFAATVRRLIARTDITAVVTANDFAALELLAALRASGRAQAQWPAIVGFDNHPLAQGQLLTSLQLPYEELGRSAGDLLWERRNGLLDDAPQQRLVQMRLIPRLTCQPDRISHVALPLASGVYQTPTISIGELATT